MQALLLEAVKGHGPDAGELFAVVRGALTVVVPVVMGDGYGRAAVLGDGAAAVDDWGVPLIRIGGRLHRSLQQQRGHLHRARMRLLCDPVALTQLHRNLWTAPHLRFARTGVRASRTTRPVLRRN